MIRFILKKNCYGVYNYNPTTSTIEFSLQNHIPIPIPSKNIFKTSSHSQFLIHNPLKPKFKQKLEPLFMSTPQTQDTPISPIIPSLPSNSNSHISLFQIKKPISLSLSLSLSLSISMASFKPSIPITSDRSARPSGEVHLIVGPMFAGKTTALLRRIKSEGNNGRYVY